MAASDELVRRLLHEDADRIRVSHVLHERTVGARSPNALRVRALAITTALALVALVGIAASVLVGESGQTPQQPATGQTDGEADAFATVPSPPGVSITRPATHVPNRLAAFSGTWEGIWNPGGLPSRLIVEEVNTDSASLVYAWGTTQHFGSPPGWQRIHASVSEDGRIEFGTPTPGTDQIGECNAMGCVRIRFTFSSSADKKTIIGRREASGPAGNFLASVTMRRAATPGSGRTWPVALGALGLVVLGAGAGIAGQHAWRRLRAT